MSKLSKEFKQAMTTFSEYLNEHNDVKQSLEESFEKIQSYVSSLEKKVKTQEKKEKKEKKESESGEGKPKKKLSSYFFFMKEMRPEVAKSNEGFSVTEISKELGRMWKELSDSEKEDWKVRAQTEQE